MSLKILSQNVMCWGVEGKSSFEMRRPLMQRAVRESGADIIGFQEVTPVWKEYFDKDLSDFEHYLVYRSEKNPEGTPIYWNPARVEMLNCGHFWLSETPTVSSLGWDARCVRITCWALFRELESGSQFAFVNTHLDHVGMTAQVKGIEQICAFIRQRFGDDMPLILTGDFNAQPDSRVIAVTDTLLQDARSAAKTTTDGITFHGFGEHAPIIIDYIYLSRNIGCDRFEIVDIHDDKTVQSDHYGVLAHLNI